jgi:nicotinamide mononucleotide (NMN) deamidase PncC
MKRYAFAGDRDAVRRQTVAAALAGVGEILTH